MRRTIPLAWTVGMAALAIPAILVAKRLRPRGPAKARGRNAVPSMPTRIRRRWRFDAPCHRVFAYWSGFTAFPQFLEGVQAVLPLERDHFLFELKSPGGSLAYWEAVLTRYRPDEEIAWVSDPFSSLQCAGWVRFSEDGDATVVELETEYGRGSSWIAEGIERFLIDDLPRLLDKDLERMKNLIENGSTEL